MRYPKILLLCAISTGVLAAVPVITSAPTATGEVDNAFAFTITADNLGAYPQFISFGLPDGLFQWSDGKISGYPSAGGVFSVLVTVVNSSAPPDSTNSASSILTIAITGGAGAPVIVGDGRIAGIQGLPLVGGVSATGALPIGFDYQGLPAGLSSNGNLITGTPTGSGTTGFSVKASNPYGSGTATLQIIATGGSPVITSPLSVSGQVESPVSYSLTAIGQSSLSYSIDSSNLPRGLRLQGANLIGGCFFDAGTYKVPITVSNSSGQASDTISFNVAPLEASNETGSIRFSEALKTSPGHTGASGSITISGTVGMNGLDLSKVDENSFFAVQVGDYFGLELLANAKKFIKGKSATFAHDFQVGVGNAKLSFKKASMTFSVSFVEKTYYDLFSARAADYIGKTVSIGETLPVTVLLTLNDSSDSAFAAFYVPIQGRSAFRTVTKNSSTFSVGRASLSGKGQSQVSGEHVVVNPGLLLTRLSGGQW